MKILQIIHSASYIVISIVAFIFADSIDSALTGYYISSERYGADAYTGIQNAIAETGNIVSLGNGILSEGFKYLFILIGLYSLLIGLSNLFKIIIENKSKNVTNTQSSTVPPPLPKDNLS